MPIDFCPGYCDEPFTSLVREYPGPSVYPTSDFRTEWGPIFHRGRLDGTARILAIGQDPAQHEAVVRRILVGAAGKRVQGFTAKLGITRSYVLVNTFLYSVYGQNNGAGHVADAAVATYRNRWFKAILDQGGIEVVVAFGSLADTAWQKWLHSPDAQGRPVLAYAHVPHPTSPNSAGKSPAQVAQLTHAMLEKYNTAIVALRPAILNPDTPQTAPLYGAGFAAAELPDIPMADLPAGTPPWMATEDGWATRKGNTTASKRRTISVVVPPAVQL